MVELDRIRQAREKVALLIYRGEGWLLPHFERLNQEVEAREKHLLLMNQAMAIAKDAMARETGHE